MRFRWTKRDGKKLQKGKINIFKKNLHKMRGLKRSIDDESEEAQRKAIPRPEEGVFFVPCEKKGRKTPGAPRKPRRPAYVDTEVHVPDWKCSKVNKENFILFCREHYGLVVQVTVSEHQWANVVFQSVEDKRSFMEHDYEVSQNFGEIKILPRY